MISALKYAQQKFNAEVAETDAEVVEKACQLKVEFKLKHYRFSKNLDHLHEKMLVFSVVSLPDTSISLSKEFECRRS